MFAFVTRSVRTNSCVKLLRTLHSKPQSLSEVNEIEIPVPWGKVTGKLWGSQDKQPLLAMHGWQDNAASFDSLAPLIAKKIPVLAIDLPGHGLSSWLPPGFMYNELVYLLLIRRIRNYFKWEKIKILAHSLSAMTTYWYAATFPKELQYVIALDFYKFPSMKTDQYTSLFESAIKAFLKLEESHSAQPSYSENEITKKWFGAYMHLDETACKILMSRGVTQKEDGTYIFNRDPRIRVIPIHTMFSGEQLEEFAKLIKCPYLILKANDSFYPELETEYYKALNILKAYNNDIYFEKVEGKHHFHLTHAELLADFIVPFLEKYD